MKNENLKICQDFCDKWLKKSKGIKFIETVYGNGNVITQYVMQGESMADSIMKILENSSKKDVRRVIIGVDGVKLDSIRVI